MNRIGACFQSLRSKGRKGLLPFVTAGDPSPECTPDLMHALVQGGADLIELGIPFSDPMADGPVIQRSSERALAGGTRLCDVFAMAKTFRQRNAYTPVVLMGYINPLEAYGYESFARQARQAGVDGVLLVDMPFEESVDLAPLLSDHNLEQIYLLAPTSSIQRTIEICKYAGGFLYYVTLKGVTGSDHLDLQQTAVRLSELRQLSTLPLAAGFGVKTPESAACVAIQADAVVIGSALVEHVHAAVADGTELAAARNFLHQMRQAVDAVHG